LASRPSLWGGTKVVYAKTTKKEQCWFSFLLLPVMAESGVSEITKQRTSQADFWTRFAGTHRDAGNSTGHKRHRPDSHLSCSHFFQG
jgi:hypothetical protein